MSVPQLNTDLRLVSEAARMVREHNQCLHCPQHCDLAPVIPLHDDTDALAKAVVILTERRSA